MQEILTKLQSYATHVQSLKHYKRKEFLQKVLSTKAEPTWAQYGATKQLAEWGMTRI